MNRVLLILFFFVILCMHDVIGVECVAHRGFISDCHENTIEAIRAACNAGADRVEVDVRMLADNTLVLFHDKMVGEVEVSKLSYKQLQDLTQSYHVPTLEEVFVLFPDKHLWLLDLKSNEPLFVKQLLKILSDKPSLIPDLIFQSKNISLLNVLSNRLDNPRLFYVTSLNRRGVLQYPPNPNILAVMLKTCNISGVSAKGRQFVTQEYVDAFRNMGLDYYVWTINAKDRMVYYISLDVDGVITDFPDLW